VVWAIWLSFFYLFTWCSARAAALSARSDPQGTGWRQLAAPFCLPLGTSLLGLVSAVRLRATILAVVAA